jgi:hypothetical protein
MARHEPDRSCTQKVAYPTRAAAGHAIKALIRKRRVRPGDLGIYRCDWCGNYHTGHRRGHLAEPGRRRRRRYTDNEN